MPRTLAQNADYIANTIKPAIKSAIEAQGVTVSASDSFLDYATRISEIEGGGGGTALYELYDYIQSDGTQCIDTGHQLVAGDSVNIHYIPISDGMNYGSAWGFVWSAVDAVASTSGLLLVSSNLKDRYDVNTQRDRTSWNNWQIYTDSLTVNGGLNANVELFGTHSSVNGYAKMRLYSFAINGDYYLPAKRKSDGVFGLYDVANETFLTDVASGNAFTAGSKIMDIYS